MSKEEEMSIIVPKGIYKMAHKTDTSSNKLDCILTDDVVMIPLLESNQENQDKDDEIVERELKALDQMIEIDNLKGQIQSLQKEVEQLKFQIEEQKRLLKIETTLKNFWENQKSKDHE